MRSACLQALPSRGLIPAKDDGDDLPPLKRQDGYAVKALPGQNAQVIGDGAISPKGRFLGFVLFKGLDQGGPR